MSDYKKWTREVLLDDTAYQRTHMTPPARWTHSDQPSTTIAIGVDTRLTLALSRYLPRESAVQLENERADALRELYGIERDPNQDQSFATHLLTFLEPMLSYVQLRDLANMINERLDEYDARADRTILLTARERLQSITADHVVVGDVTDDGLSIKYRPGTGPLEFAETGFVVRVTEEEFGGERSGFAIHGRYMPIKDQLATFSTPINTFANIEQLASFINKA